MGSNIKQDMTKREGEMEKGKEPEWDEHQKKKKKKKMRDDDNKHDVITGDHRFAAVMGRKTPK